MRINAIKCEAVKVDTPSGICVGIAKTKQGEVSIIDGRTPSSKMCSNAFCSLSNAAFIMMATDKMPGEKDGYMDRVCPHGNVTFRISRTNEEYSEPFNQRGE